MMRYLAPQFGRPEGWLGRLVGWLMAARNRARTEWTVGLLDIQPADQVLEVGFGPGVGLQLSALKAFQGLTAGIDHSAAMLAEAGRRNADAIRAGRVQLRLGSVASLPYSDGQFDKAFAINSLRFWPAPVENLAEVRRVLTPGGRVAITEQPMGAGGDAEVPQVREMLQTRLAAAGFREVRLEAQLMRPATCVCAVALK